MPQGLSDLPPSAGDAVSECDKIAIQSCEDVADDWTEDKQNRNDNYSN
jgi:hypothetical protein